jgi:hypothetical protein
MRYFVFKFTLLMIFKLKQIIIDFFNNDIFLFIVFVEHNDYNQFKERSYH